MDTIRTAELYAGPARTSDELHQARALHTRRYEAVGLIGPQPNNELYDDGWIEQREYLVVATDTRVYGSASLITPTDTLPTLRAFGIDGAHDRRLAAAWHRRRLAEVSALAIEAGSGGRPAVRALLYRALWRACERRLDHDQWIMTMRLDRFDALSRLFPVPFELLSRADSYHRQPAIACALDLRLGRAALALRAPYLLAWLDAEHDDETALVTSGPPSDMSPAIMGVRADRS